MCAAAVRSRCHMVLDAGLAGRLEHFAVDLAALDGAAEYVAETIRRNYPSLQVPPHARWRQFVIDGEDRYAEAALKGIFSPEPNERARQRFELAIISVLLDAGAGPKWRWQEPVRPVRVEDGKFATRPVGRSEGLALASLNAWVARFFASDRRRGFRADGAALKALSAEALGEAFLVSPDNPLEGLEGRVDLLNRLGDTIAARPDLFGSEGRLGNLFDALQRRAVGRKGVRHGGSDTLPTIAAPAILALVLEALGPIWPGRIVIEGINLGDSWRHPAIDVPGPTNGLVPFHKLSQWLSYSLIEPLEEAGIVVTDIDGLTGLAEYRNGGLFIDTGVLKPRSPTLYATALAPADEPIVEWRALTVALLDAIAPHVRSLLGVDAARMPLASILEGGTWSAGRRIAREKRADGRPPLTIVSDGSVF